MRIEILSKPIGEIIEYENNPRNNDRAVEPVIKSIKEFGFKVPILLDENNVIIAGHTRLKAAQKLGLEFVPCIMCDDLTPEQVKAFRLVDNKTAELADWDMAKLNIELSETDFDLEAFGFYELPEIDVDDYLQDREESANESEKEPERVQCPHCGEWVDLT